MVQSSILYPAVVCHRTRNLRKTEVVAKKERTESVIMMDGTLDSLMCAS